MPTEMRNGRRVLVHEVPVEQESLASAVASYEVLLNASASAVNAECAELEAGSGVIVRVGSVLSAGRTDPAPVRRQESCEVVRARVERSGGRVLAWFSLRRAWVFDGEPDVDASVLIVHDVVGSAWSFLMPSEQPRVCSKLPVTDVAAALAWYPALFSALGWGDEARRVVHGACVDLLTDHWGARVYPVSTWPFDDLGIQEPSDWNGHTGEVTYEDPQSFDVTRRRLETLGLSVRGSTAFLATTDPFGYEWYVGLERSKAPSEQP